MSTSERDLAPRLRAFQLAAAVALAVAGIAAVGPLADGLAPAFPDWRNLPLVGVALLLAAVLVAGYALALRGRGVAPGAPVLLHLLGSVLALHVAAVLVLLWKYAAGWIPDNWTGEVILLYTGHPGSLAELYSAANREHPPFATPMYPPGYFALLRMLASLLGDGMAPLRAATLGSLLAISLLLARLSGDGRRGAFPLLTPALFLASFPIVTWSGAPSKPEFVACALALAGLAFYLRRGQEGRAGWILPSSALFGAALLCKYSVLAAVAATALHLLATRRLRDCALFSGATLAWFGSVYALLWLPTGGGVALFSIIANLARPDPSKLQALDVLGFLASGFVVLCLATALFALLGERAADARARRREEVLSIGMLLSFAWFGLAVVRPGSSANYVLEGAMLGSLLLGAVLERSCRSGERSGATLLAASLAAYMLATTPSQLALLARSYGEEADAPRVEAILAELAPGPDEYVFSDVYYTWDVARAGHRPLVLDSFLYTLMSDNGRLDTAPALRLLREGRVPYLVLSNTLEAHASRRYGYRVIPADLLIFLRENYRCSREMERWDGRLLVVCELDPDRRAP